MRLFLIISGIALLAACSETPPPFRSSVVPPVEWGKNFVMTSQDGQRYDTASLQGKVQVLFFGFTHCPDICAPTLAKLAQVMKQLGTNSSSVQVLFVSVDPEHDTPALLKKYLAGFDTGFIGLTGSMTESLAVQRDHKIFSEGQENTIAHSGTVLVKDKKGQLRLVMNESLSVEDMAHDLKLLLKQ